MTRLAGSPWDYDILPVHPLVDPPVDEDWIDRLISLRVLALHGDADADAQARRWLADDPDARRLWDSVSEIRPAHDGRS